MKPAPFAYERASTVEEAIGLLQRYEGDARLLAGGQSLVPLLNMRLLMPGAVIDVNGVTGLDEIREEGDQVTIGALTRYRTIEWSPTLGARLPLLTEIVRYVGDRQVRSRGTIGGSLSHADPTGELPLAAIALGATVVVQGPEARRAVRAEEFFLGPYSTVLEPDEMVVEVRFPVRRTVSAVLEHARRHGDFAVIGVAVVGEPDGDGGWRAVRLALGGVSDTPFLAEKASEILSGSTLDADSIEQAAVAALEAADPPDDIRASADYRRHLIPIYVRRALELMQARRSEGAR